MKKIILFVLLGLIPSSTAFAEELVVHLTSGNAVVIQYTGAIQGVTFQGKNDAIAGLDMPTTTKPAARAQQPVAEKQAVTSQPEQVEAKNGKERWLRFKWAEPKSED
ncbi:MAG: hypothetical protein NT087_04595 [Deltaproteobacteria bacterium]|nr:hypothetical protein [Deltaproteobacteria bacterium]